MAEIVVKLVNGELAGKTMQSITKEVSAATLALKKAAVGTQEWVDANKKLEGAKQLQADLKKQIESTATASDQLKAAWNKLPGAQFFNQIGNSFKTMKGGVGGLVSQFGVLKSAIAATGIGLLVLAIATLVDWFTKTDEGMTLMSGLFKGLGNVTDKLFASIRSLAEAFKNPKQAMADFVDFIKSQVVNRINSFGVALEGLKKILNGDFKEGFKALADANIQFTLGIEHGTDKLIAFGESIADAVQAGIDYEKSLDAIEDKTRKLNVAQAETEKTVSALLLQSKNVQLSYEDRIALLDKASAAELKNHAAQLENAKALEALQLNELKNKQLVGKARDEVDQKYRDAQIARINLDKESINLQEKIDNRRSQLLEKQAAELAKEAAEELKTIQNIEELKVEAMQNGIDQDIAKIKLGTALKIEALTGDAEQVALQKVLLQEIEENQIQEVRDKYAKEAADKDKKAKDEEAKRLKDEADKEKGLLKEKADFETKITNQRMSLASDAANFAGDLLTKEVKNQKAASVIKKGIALVDIGLQLEKELAANAVAGAALSASYPPVSIPLGVAYTASADGISILRSVLAAAKVAAFRKGGIAGIPDGVLSGPSHENNGIPLIAEGDEIILTKGVFRNPQLRSMASAINVAGGGKSFATGGPVNPFRDRAAIPSESSRSSENNNTASNERLTALLMGNFDAINKRFDRIEVVNVVSKPDKTGYQDQIDLLNKIKGEAAI